MPSRDRSWTHARSALLLLLLGLTLLAVGWGVFGPLGPVHDATPEIERRLAKLAAIAHWLYGAGALALLGAAGCLALALTRR
jgi:ABC-type enterobactin transport system permease subunit